MRRGSKEKEERRGQGWEERLEKNMVARDLSRAVLFLLPWFIRVTTSKATHTLGAL